MAGYPHDLLGRFGLKELRWMSVGDSRWINIYEGYHIGDMRCESRAQAEDIGSTSPTPVIYRIRIIKTKRMRMK